MDDTVIEAIEDGKIVRVSEKYAKKEGLPILRNTRFSKLQSDPTNTTTSPTFEREKRLKEYSRTHTNWRQDWKDKQVVSELEDNWHWQIRIERKKRGMTRKQLAYLLNEPEDSVRLLESGVLPRKDFVLINKLQQQLGINLRKDGKDFSRSIKDMYRNENQTSNSAPNQSDEIEILDEEI